jgi:PAS domain S-box-containing protein
MRMVSADDFRRKFFQQLGNPWDLSLLFDYLPDTYFYAKNRRGQFVMVNTAIAAMHGCANPEEVIGKTDHDFSPRDLADLYVAEDRRVMETHQPVTNQAWLIADHRGELKWCLSSKIPLFHRSGRVIGIAGAMRDVEKASSLLAPYGEMKGVLEELLTRYAEKIDFHRLARLASLATGFYDQSYFTKYFRRQMGSTPLVYRRQYRRVPPEDGGAIFARQKR